MALIMALFDDLPEARTALQELAQRGYKQHHNEVGVVSHSTVAETYTDLEQHPEINAPGSVSSLGAPTPPGGYDPTFTPGRLAKRIRTAASMRCGMCWRQRALRILRSAALPQPSSAAGR